MLSAIVVSPSLVARGWRTDIFRHLGQLLCLDLASHDGVTQARVRLVLQIHRDRADLCNGQYRSVE
jgi:hypothetical protein